MSRHVIGSALLLFLGQPLPSPADILVISSNGENQALLVDPSSLTVLARLPTGAGPHDIAVSPDGRYAYIAITGGPQDVGHTITVLDLAQRAVKATFDVSPYKQPHDLKVSRDGTLLWVTCAPSKAVLEIDTRNGRITK
jgi:DNA-binding beta-propeller fold protein YncE